MVEKHMWKKISGFLFLITLILIISIFFTGEIPSFNIQLGQQVMLTITVVLGFIALIVLFTPNKLLEEHVTKKIGGILFLIHIILLLITRFFSFGGIGAGNWFWQVKYTLNSAIVIGIGSMIISSISSRDKIILLSAIVIGIGSLILLVVLM